MVQKFRDKSRLGRQQRKREGPAALGPAPKQVSVSFSTGRSGNSQYTTTGESVVATQYVILFTLKIGEMMKSF